MEIEARFALPDEPTLERLAGLDTLGEFSLSAPRRSLVRDVYLDTADRAILAAGYCCRRRDSGTGIVIAFEKSAHADGDARRRGVLELEMPAYRPPAEWEAGPERELIIGIVGDRDLFPLLELERERRARVASRGTGRIGELSLDSVRIESGGRARRFFELEFEPELEAIGRDLEDFVRSLSEGWELRAQPRSDFELALEFLGLATGDGGLLGERGRSACARLALRRDAYGRRARALLAFDAGADADEAGSRSGLSPGRARHWLGEFGREGMGIFPRRLSAGEDAEEGQPPRQGAGPGVAMGDTMGDAARKILLAQFEKMLDREKGALAGEDAEELHGMRVAARRMLAVMDVFSDYLDKEEFKPYAKTLKRSCKALGAVRDLNVFRSKTESYLESLSLPRRSGMEPLLAAWRDESEARLAEMNEYFEGRDYSRFKARFREFLESQGEGARPAASAKPEPSFLRVRHALPSLLFSSYASLRAFDECFSGSEASLLRYHQLRVAAKRLRYTLEFFLEPLGPAANSLVERTRRLQDHLGNLQDAAIASDILRSYLRWGGWRKAAREEAPLGDIVVAPEIAEYFAFRQGEIRKLLDSFPKALADVSGPDFFNRMAILVATLAWA